MNYNITNMGFRSTFITEDISLFIPQWFVTKWGDKVHFGRNRHEIEPFAVMPISSQWEAKTYGLWQDLPHDIQLMMQQDKEWNDRDYPIILVYLHECGGITRVEIHKDKILYSEPIRWKQTDGVTHDD